VQEPVFGPLVVFGLGGVAPLLRGTPPVDTGALAGVLLRVSRLADELPEVAELDLNPVLATPGGARVVDARIRVRPAQPRDPILRQLR
jgi:acyl-CoA synthetase (NDP forming)